MSEARNRLVQIGDRVSEWVSNLFAHPYMQVGVIIFSATWFLLGFETDLLTAALSILAITLGQMVLNRQNDRETEDRKRDIAMHAKLDELIHAKRGARDEMAGIEELEENQIAELKERAKALIDDEGAGAGDAEERAVAKAAVEKAAEAKRRSKVRMKA